MTVHCATKREAQRVLREKLSEIDQGKTINPSRVTVGQYLSDWLSSSQMEPRNREAVSSWVNHQLIPSIGHIKLQSLTVEHIEAMYAEKRISGRIDGKGGLAKQSLVQLNTVLRRALEKAEERGIITLNPCKKLKENRPKRDRTRTIHVLDPKEVRRFLLASEGSQIFALVAAALGTGLRLGELLGLQWREVDLAAARLRVRRRANNRAQLLEGAKSKRSLRTVSLPPSTVEVFRRHKLFIAEEKKRLGKAWTDLDLVFPNSTGGVQGLSTHSWHLEKICKATGLKVTMHGLRHTHASLLIHQGVHPKVISERLGHSSIAITMDTYGHLFPDSGEAAEQIEIILRDQNVTKTDENPL